MLFNSALAATAFAISSVSATPLVARDVGPSGSVVTPSGGLKVDSNNGTGVFQLNYKTVNNQNYNGLKYTTAFINVNLEPLSGGQSDGKTYPLVNGLAPPSAGANINSEFIVGPACGQYRITVYESQLVSNGSIIQFKAAAPDVTIKCTPAAPGLSGSLSAPSGGATINNKNGQGFIDMVYNVVYQPSKDYVTTSIDIELEPVKPGPVIKRLATGLAPLKVGDSQIKARLLVGNVSGEYRFVVYETHKHENSLIRFRAQAPSITIL